MHYLDSQMIIMPGDIIHLISVGYIRNYNEFYDVLRVYLKKDESLPNLLDRLKQSKYSSYIEYAIYIAHHINKLDEIDINYLYANRNIPEIENAIESLQLKKPDNQANSQRIIHIIEEDIKRALQKTSDFRKSFKMLGSLLYVELKDGNIKLDEFPSTQYIEASNENDDNNNITKLKSYIITSYTHNGFDVHSFYHDCSVLDELTMRNNVEYKLGENIYYNTPIPGHSMTPYDFYRLTLYKKLYEMN